MSTREYHRDYSREYYHRKKEELISLLGGCCKRCGAKLGLQFDHIDPNTKNFPISRMLNHTWEEVLEEVKKCQLLCLFCHKDKSKAEGSLLKNKARGEKNGSAKLTQEMVDKARELYASGTSVSELSRIYGVARVTIRAAVKGRTWEGGRAD